MGEFFKRKKKQKTHSVVGSGGGAGEGGSLPNSGVHLHLSDACEADGFRENGSSLASVTCPGVCSNSRLSVGTQRQACWDERKDLDLIPGDSLHETEKEPLSLFAYL